MFRPAKLAIGWRSERGSILSSTSVSRLRDARHAQPDLAAQPTGGDLSADLLPSEDAAALRARALRGRTI